MKRTDGDSRAEGVLLAALGAGGLAFVVYILTIMPGPARWFLAGAVVSYLLSAWNFLGALANLRADRPDSLFHIVVWSKLFASRENFTERGRRILNFARLMWLVGTVLVIAGMKAL